MPVLTLKEITSKNVNFGLTSCVSEPDDSFHISTLEKTFESLHFFISHSVNLGSEFEVSLFLHQLSDSHTSLNSDLLRVEVVSSGRDELHHGLFFDLNVPLLSEFESFGVVSKTDHYLDSFLVLSTL